MINKEQHFLGCIKTSEEKKDQLGDIGKGFVLRLIGHDKGLGLMKYSNRMKDKD